MSDQEILIKAIQKAMDSVWMGDVDSYSFVGNKICFVMSEISEFECSYFDIIFSHNFAKAIWRNEGYIYDTLRYWQYHLQQMVISENPIDYLREHMDD